MKKDTPETNDVYEVVAYARINEKGDLFDLRLQNNPYTDQKTVVPLYMKKESNERQVDRA